jgi:hypothetical protein
MINNTKVNGVTGNIKKYGTNIVKRVNMKLNFLEFALIRNLYSLITFLSFLVGRSL